jgi:hypothetical protein
MPMSLPEIFADHLRMLNPDDPKAEAYVEDDRMLEVARVFARLALTDDFVPKDFTRSGALEALRASGEDGTDLNTLLRRFVLNGVLSPRMQGTTAFYRFVLDPVAEYVGAEAFADECGSDSDRWNALLNRGRQAPGFVAALRLTRQAYGLSRGWPAEA